MNENEIWRDIEGYEGLYQVSNMGRVKTIERIFTDSKGREYKIISQIKQIFKTKNGYIRVKLWKNGKSKNFLVHRLVAIAFIDNPNNFRCVNHKDENKENNYVENLEWCDHKYNVNFGNHKIKVSNTQKNRKDLSKPIIQIDLEGNIINQYPSIKEAARYNNLFHSNISKVLLGKNKTCGGYIWKYKNEGEEN